MHRRPARRHPRGARARGPTVPRAPLRPSRRGRPGRSWSPRRTTSIGPDLRARARGPPPGQRRPPRPAGRGARRRARRPLPARGPDPRRLALRRDAAQGSRIRRSTSTSRPIACPGTDHERTQRGLLRAARPRAVRTGRRGPARTSGRWPAPERTATSCSARPASTRARSSPCSTTRPARPRERLAVRGRRPAGCRGRPTTTASAIACGRCRPTARARPAEIAGALIAAAAAGPVTIADGHHRYETALRYRDERRMTRSCEEDPAFDYLLTLFLEATGEPLTVLPTHRLVRGIGDDGAAALLRARRRAVRGRAGRSAPRRSSTPFEGAGLAAGGDGAVRPVDPARAAPS